MNSLFLCKFKWFHRWHSNYKDSPFGRIEIQHCLRCEKINVVTPSLIDDCMEVLIFGKAGANVDRAIELVGLWIEFCILSGYKNISRRKE